MANEEKITPGQENTDPDVIKEPKEGDPAAGEPKDGGQKDGPEGEKDPEQEDGEGEPDKALADEDKAEGKAPESYEKFSLPEGFEYDEKLAGEFGGVAKELGLSQDQAQKLVDHYIKLSQEGIAVQTERLAQVSEEWKSAAETDKEYGGAKFEENIALAKNALDTLGSPELSKYLVDSQLGNHPEVIRFCWKVGRLLADDHQPDDLAAKVKDPNKKLTEDEVAKLMFGSEKK